MHKLTKRRTTTTTSTIKLANFVGSNKSAFDGKSRQAIIALIEATFPGEFFSPRTIAAIMEVNGIAFKRSSASTISKSDRPRAIARLLQIIVNRLTGDLGTQVLSENEKLELAKLVGGKHVPNVD